MKFTYGSFFLFFALLWVLIIGNYHGYTHWAAGVGISNGLCKHGFLTFLLFGAICIDVILLFILGFWLFTHNFWDNEIHLDKFDKK